MSPVGFEPGSCFNFHELLHPFDYTDKIRIIDVWIMDYIDNLWIFQHTKTKIVSVL